LAALGQLGSATLRDGEFHVLGTLIGAMIIAFEDVTDIVLSHAHFDHMGSIGKFPKARLHIQKREILSWHEVMALPPQFGFLTERRRALEVDAGGEGDRGFLHCEGVLISPMALFTALPPAQESLPKAGTCDTFPS